MKYPDGSVKHATSPSHRDRSRQVVTLRRSNSARVRTTFARPSCCNRLNLYSTYLLGRACFLSSGRDCCLFLPPTRQRCLVLRNFDTVLSLPILLQVFVPTIAWKASPTRTPPPICTSTPVSKTALVSRSWAPRAIKGIHDARFPAIRFVTHVLRVFATVAALQLPTWKASF